MSRALWLFAAAALQLSLCVPAAIAQEKVELRFFCTSDSGGCDAWRTVLDRYEDQNPDVSVLVDHVPYNAEVEALPVQLEAGEGPDLAVVTNLSGFNRYYLDLTNRVDAGYFEENYGPTQLWLRNNDPSRKEVYGFQEAVTVAGAFVNVTLFEQAGIEIPAEGATWEEWAEAAKQVAEATETPFAMAMDRSGHRYLSLAISYGAKIMDENERPIVDDGLRAATEDFVRWHKEGIMPFELWGAIGGSRGADFFNGFRNGEVVMYFSGSWQLGRMQTEIGDFFEWRVVPSPCGPSSCTGMIGGGAIVGFSHTKHPDEVARVIEFMAQSENIGEVLAHVAELPANQTLVKDGVKYVGLSAAQEEALQTFTRQIPKIDPTAYRVQGSVYQRIYTQTLLGRVSQAITGELTVEEALERYRQDVERAIDSAQGPAQ